MTNNRQITVKSLLFFHVICKIAGKYEIISPCFADVDPDRACAMNKHLSILGFYRNSAMTALGDLHTSEVWALVKSFAWPSITLTTQQVQQGTVSLG